MNQRTCRTCGITYQPRHSRQMYCASKCRPRPRVLVEKTCDCCGVTCLKERRQPRYENTYCGQLCRDYARFGPTSTDLPKDHWAVVWGTTCEWRPAPKPPRFTTGRCRDCGEWFTAQTKGSVIDYCSTTCRRRTVKRRRRAREFNSPGEFRYAQVIRQYLRQGKACAYCHQPCNGLPDPEHVIPLSRGGRNDMSNIVAACRTCNSDKSDMTPDEWQHDRVRRGLAPIHSLTGPAFFHLMSTMPQGLPHNHPSAA